MVCVCGLCVGVCVLCVCGVCVMCVCVCLVCGACVCLGAHRGSFVHVSKMKREL